MTVTVRDRASPQKSAQATVTINVNRDASPPRFRAVPYSVSVSENRPVFSSIFKVTAEDLDLRVKLPECTSPECQWFMGKGRGWWLGGGGVIFCKLS